MPAVASDNAPLIELVAELRWEMPAMPQEAHARFAALATSRGFGRREPAASSDDVVGYRPADPLLASPIYRLGPGIFSATVLPPYRNWAGFEPKLRDGIDMLYRAFQEAGIEGPRCTEAMVRYVDAFRAAFTHGEPTAAFAAALGFGLQLPASLRRLCPDPRRIVPSIRVTIPLASGEMIVAIAEENAGGEPAVIMDMAVTITRYIDGDPVAAMGALIEARSVIHEVFVDVMRNLESWPPSKA